MKKILSVILLVLLLVMPSSLAFADYESVYILDTVGVLSDDDLMSLDDRYTQLEERYGEFALVLIVNNYADTNNPLNINGTEDFDQFVRDIYEEYDLTGGYLLVLSLDDIDYRLYNGDREIDPIDEYNILESTFAEMDNGDYKKALIAYADGLEAFFVDPDRATDHSESDDAKDSVPSYLYDFVGLLREKDAESLERKLASIEESTGFPAYIVVVDDFLTHDMNISRTDDFPTFAKEFYDYCALEGALLILSMADRDIAIHAGDDVDTTYNQQAADYVRNQTVSFLKNDDYAGGFNRFAEISKEILTAHSEGREYVAPRNQLAWWWIPVSILIGALIAFVIMAVLTAPLRTVAMKAGASSYLVNNSLDYHENSDVFLYRNVVRKRIEKSSSSSSESGGTTSSGKF